MNDHLKTVTVEAYIKRTIPCSCGGSLVLFRNADGYLFSAKWKALVPVAV